MLVLRVWLVRTAATNRYTYILVPFRINGPGVSVLFCSVRDPLRGK